MLSYNIYSNGKTVTRVTCLIGVALSIILLWKDRRQNGKGTILRRNVASKEVTDVQRKVIKFLEMDVFILAYLTTNSYRVWCIHPGAVDSNSRTVNLKGFLPLHVDVFVVKV